MVSKAPVEQGTALKIGAVKEVSKFYNLNTNWPC